MECVKAARFYHAGINLIQPIFASANLCFDHSSLELSMPDQFTMTPVTSSVTKVHLQARREVT
jgi:hypothetical protein